MERAAAEQVVPALMRAAADVASTIDVVRAYAPESRAKAYAQALGKVMLAIDAVPRPIITEHRDLRRW